MSARHWVTHASSTGHVKQISVDHHRWWCFDFYLEILTFDHEAAVREFFHHFQPESCFLLLPWGCFSKALLQGLGR